MPIDLANAKIRLYEDASLTDELTDEPASQLLKWAEGQLERLAQRHSDEAAFDDAFKTLRGVVKGINRLVGQGGMLTPDEKQETTQRLVERAQALGFAVGHQADTLQAQSVLSQSEQVAALLRWVETGNTAAPAPQADALSPVQPAPTTYIPAPPPVYPSESALKPSSTPASSETETSGGYWQGNPDDSSL
ncbi:MAG: hypothetical protein SF029_01850 [bacterium]|nr:hypothetical protein [bacterium]